MGSNASLEEVLSSPSEVVDGSLSHTVGQSGFGVSSGSSMVASVLDSLSESKVPFASNIARLFGRVLAFFTGGNSATLAVVPVAFPQAEPDVSSVSDPAHESTSQAILVSGNSQNIVQNIFPTTYVTTEGISKSYVDVELARLSNLFSRNLDNIPSRASRTVGPVVGTSVSADSLSLTGTASIDTLTLANALTVLNGGTGSTTLSGILAGNGTSAMKSALIGTGLSWDGTTLSGISGTVASGTAGQFPYYATDGSTITATSSIFLAASGNVGIGTSSPSENLEIGGLGRIKLSGTAPRIYTGSDTSSLKIYGGPNTSTGAGVEFYGDNAAGTYSGLTTAGSMLFRSKGTGSIIFGHANAGSLTGDGAQIVMSNVGNLGIGTTTPYAKLSIKGAGTTTGVNFQTTNSSDSPLFTILDSGNVGIGTTSPVTLLHVGSTGTVTLAGTKALFTSSDNAPGLIEARNTFAGSFADARITSIANDGSYISVAQPSTVNALTLLGQTRSTSSFIFNSAGLEGGTARNLAIGTLDAKDLIFGSNNTERTRITSAGNVGIGTTSPYAKLSIKGAGTTTGVNFQTTNSSDSPLFTILDSGSVGIGTTPSYTLDVYKTGTVFQRIASDGAANLWLSAGGSSSAALYYGTASGAAPLVFLSQKTGVGEVARITSAGNFGIGTTTPWAQLSVNPNGITGPAFAVGSSTNTNFIVSNAGMVGINTATPQAYLDITNSNPNTIDAIYWRTSGQISGILSQSNGTSAGVLILKDGNNANAIRLDAKTNNASYINNGGNFGIGVTAPSSKLSVGSSGLTFADGQIADFHAGTNENLLITGHNGLSSGVRLLAANDADNALVPLHLAASQFYLSTGNVGIGTTSPYAKLSIKGAGTTTGVNFQTTNSSDSPLFTILDSGNVGIGTSDIDSRLTVKGVADFDAAIQIKRYDNDGAYQVGLGERFVSGIGGLLDIFAVNGSLTGNLGASQLAMSVGITAVGIGTSSPTARLAITGNGATTGRAFVIADSSNTEKFTVLDNGNVGIGTTTPGQKLAIAGNVALTTGGTIYGDTTTTSLMLNTAQGSFLSYGTSFINVAGPILMRVNGTDTMRQDVTGTYFGGNINPLNRVDISGRAVIGTGYAGINTAPTNGLLVQGNVGIGSTSPFAKLAVHANNGDTGTTLFAIGSSTASATTTLFSVLNNGNVGIGTINPTLLLTINGGLRISSSSAQILAAGSASASSPDYSFSNETNTGFAYRTTGAVQYSAQGGASLQFQTTGLGVGQTKGVWWSSSSNTVDATIPDTGIYRNAAGRIEINTGTAGTLGDITLRSASTTGQTVLATGSGNVGIGTTSPYAKLSVKGAGSTTGANFQTTNSSDSPLFTILDSGNVGIGTAAPTYGLDVSGTFRATATSTFSNGLGIGTAFPSTKLEVNSGVLNVANSGLDSALSEVVRFQLAGSTGTSNWRNSIYSSVSSTASASIVKFSLANSQTTQADVLTLLGNGNVGIGTTNPGYSLDISKAGAAAEVYNTTNGASTALYLSSNQTGGVSKYFTILQKADDASNGALYFNQNSTAGNTVMTLQSGGNVGIGTTSPGSKLQVWSNSNGSLVSSVVNTNASGAGALAELYVGDDDTVNYTSGVRLIKLGDNFTTNGAYVQNAGVLAAGDTLTGGLSLGAFNTGSGGVIRMYTGGFADSNERLRITSAGNVGIGTTSPYAKLSVHANAGETNTTLFAIASSTASATTTLFSVSNAGTIISLGNTNLGYTTDQGYRLAINGDVLTSGMIRAGTSGTASAPTFSFSGAGNTDNGLFLATTDQLGFSTAGTERIRVDASGNVGIGTTTPGQLLDIYGANNQLRLSSAANGIQALYTFDGGTNAAAIYSRNDNGIAGNGLHIENRLAGGKVYLGGGTSQNNLVVDSSGNVGIGTTSPAYKLEVNGTAGIGGALTLTTGAAIVFKNNTASGIQILDATNFDSSINIGNRNSSFPTVGNRQITIGTGNQFNTNTIYGFAVGSDNTASSFATNFVQIVGSLNTVGVNGGTTGVSILGKSNSFSPASSAGGTPGGFIIGSNNSVLNSFSAILGMGQTTTADNQLIIAQTQSNVSTGGYNDIYFGTGPRSNNQNLLGTNITINGSGAGAGTDLTGGSVTIAGGKSTGAALGGDVLFKTADSLASGSTLQSLTTKLIVKASGNVGIGTTSPAEKLTVNGAIMTTANATLFSASGSGGYLDYVSGSSLTRLTSVNGALEFRVGTNGGTQAMNILSSGNVGIGTTNPTQVLAIKSGAPAIGLYHSTETGNYRNWGILSQSTDYGLEFKVSNAAGGDPSAAGTTRMFITNSGNVGIGTTSPGAKLQVASDGAYGSFGDNSQLVVGGSTSGNKGVYIGYDTTNNFGWITAMQKGVNTSNLILNGQATGNVGIGTTSPTSKLHVAGGPTDIVGLFDGTGGVQTRVAINAATADANSILSFQESGTNRWSIGNNGLTNAFAISTGNTLTSPIVTVLQNGNVGIGTTTPAFPLDVYSTVSSNQTYGYLNSAGVTGTNGGTNAYSIRAEGRVLAQEFNAVSDRRLKDVQFELGSAMSLDLISRLQPVSFTWKNNPGGQPVLGFIAQDVEAVIPNAVSRLATQNFPDQRSLDYGQVISVSVGAIKELNNRTITLGAYASTTGRTVEDLGLALDMIASTTNATTSSSTPGSIRFATSFWKNVFAKVSEWIGDSANGIKTVVAGQLRAKESICVDDQCLSKDDVRTLLQMARERGSAGVGAGANTPPPSPAPIPTPEAESPVPTDPPSVTATSPITEAPAPAPVPASEPVAETRVSPAPAPSPVTVEAPQSTVTPAI